MTLFAAYRSTVLKSSLARSSWRFFTCLGVLVVFLGVFVFLGREAQAKQLGKAVSSASGAGLEAAGVAAGSKSATLSEVSAVSAGTPVTGAGSASAAAIEGSKTAGGYIEGSGSSAAEAVEGGSRPVKVATNGASTAKSNPVPTPEMEQQLPAVSGMADLPEEVAPSVPEPLSVMDNPVFEPVSETAGPVLEPVGKISNPLLESVGETVSPMLEQLDMKASKVLEPLGGVVSLPLDPEVKVAGPVLQQDIPPAYASGTGLKVLLGSGPASVHLKGSKSTGSVTAGQIMADVYAAGADAMKLPLVQLERFFSTEITPGSDVIEINETPGYVPLPVLPGAPAGGAFTGSISTGELIPLLGILFLFVILLQINKSRLAAYEYLRPNSALHLVSERPG